MENKCGECFRCRYFDRYYTKEIKRFEMTDIGGCSEKGGAIVGKHDGCESYAPRLYRSRYNRLLRVILNDILNEISEVRSMIEAEDNEGKDM